MEGAEGGGFAELFVCSKAPIGARARLVLVMSHRSIPTVALSLFGPLGSGVGALKIQFFPDPASSFPRAETSHVSQPAFVSGPSSARLSAASPIGASNPCETAFA